MPVCQVCRGPAPRAGPAHLFAPGEGLCLHCSLSMRRVFRAVKSAHPELAEEELMPFVNHALNEKLMDRNFDENDESARPALDGDLLTSAAERGLDDLSVEMDALETQLAALEGRKNKEKRQRIRDKMANLASAKERGAAALSAGQLMVPGDIRVKLPGSPTQPGGKSHVGYNGLYTLQRGKLINGECMWYSGETNMALFRAAPGMYGIGCPERATEDSSPVYSTTPAHLGRVSPARRWMPHELQWGTLLYGPVSRAADDFWQKYTAPCGQERYWNLKTKRTVQALPPGTPVTWCTPRVDAVLAETFVVAPVDAAAAAAAVESEGGDAVAAPAPVPAALRAETVGGLKLKMATLLGSKNKKKRQRLLKRIAVLEGGSGERGRVFEVPVQSTVAAAETATEEPSQAAPAVLAAAARVARKKGTEEKVCRRSSKMRGYRDIAVPTTPPTPAAPSTGPARTEMRRHLPAGPRAAPKEEVAPPLAVREQPPTPALPETGAVATTEGSTGDVKSCSGGVGFTLIAAKSKGGQRRSTAASTEQEQRGIRSSRWHALRRARRLFVGNLPVSCSHKDLADYFNDEMEINGWVGSWGHYAVVRAEVNDVGKPFGFVEFRSAAECAAAHANAGCFMMYCAESGDVKQLRLERPKDYTDAAGILGAHLAGTSTNAGALADITSLQNVAIAAAATTTTKVALQAVSFGGKRHHAAFESAELNRQLTAAISTAREAVLEAEHLQRRAKAAMATVADRRTTLELEATAAAAAARSEEESRHRIAMSVIDWQLAHSIAAVDSNPTVVPAQRAAAALQAQLVALDEKARSASEQSARLKARLQASGTSTTNGGSAGTWSMAASAGAGAGAVAAEAAAAAQQERELESAAAEKEEEDEDEEEGGWITVPATTPPPSRKLYSSSGSSGSSSGEEADKGHSRSSPATVRRCLYTHHSRPDSSKWAALQAPLTRAEKAAKKARKQKGAPTLPEDAERGSGRIKASKKTVDAYLKQHRWDHVRANTHSVYRRAVDEHGAPIKQQSMVMPETPSDVRTWKNSLARLRRFTLSASPLQVAC